MSRKLLVSFMLVTAAALSNPTVGAKLSWKLQVALQSAIRNSRQTQTVPAMAALQCVPTVLQSGQASACSISLTSAVSGSTGISVVSSEGAVTVPATVNVPTGSTLASFSAAVGRVTTQETAILTATVNGTAQTVALTITPPPPSLSGQPSTLGLVGHWSFDEGSGTIAADSSGNDYHGTISGATWTAGKVGSGALSFDGKASVSIPPGAKLNLSAPFSISVWVNPSSTATDFQMILARNEYDTFLLISPHWGGYATALFGRQLDSTAGALAPSKWHLITYVAATDGQIIYIDGVAVSRDNFASASFKSTNGLTLGKMSTGHFPFTGLMDDFRIYNRVLSAEEIKDIYNASGIVTPPAAPTITSFTATPSAITPGQAVTLSWSVSYATSLSLSPGIGAVTGTSKSVFPAGTTTYTLTASNASGTVSAQTTVTVASTPPDTTPPTVPTNPTATAVSSSQIALSWGPSTDTGGSGLAGYRIYRNGSQIATSTINSYSDTGLAASTTYSYAVAAYDKAGNVSGRSALANATTQGATAPSPCTPNVTHVNPIPESSLPPKPALYQQLRDPNFNSCIQRISDTAQMGHDHTVPLYSQLQAWNADQTKVLLASGHVLNGSDYSVITTTPPYEDPRWSPKEPNIIYATDNNRLVKYDVASGVETTLRTFSEYVRFDQTGQQEELSQDGRYTMLIGFPSFGTNAGGEIFLYDIQNNVKSRTVPYLAPNCGAAGPDWVAPSPSGKYALIHWGGGGDARYCGLEAYDLNLNYIGKVTTGHAHGDLYIDPAGVEWWVDFKHDNYVGITGPRIVKSRIPKGYDEWNAGDTSGMVSLLLLDWTVGGHISCQAPRSGWCAVSNYQGEAAYATDGWQPFEQEVFKLYLDSVEASPKVLRLAHHRSDFLYGIGCPTYQEYWSQPHATISRDGTKVMFGSSWGPQCSSEAYVLDLSGGSSVSAPAVLSFAAAPSTITAGGSSNLSWAVTNATTLSITPGIGTVTGTSITVRPVVTTSYTLTASNAAASVVAYATVVVSAGTDTVPPSTPVGLSATAVSSSQISLSWAAATDTGGSGLAGYRVYRMGSQIATVAAPATTYQDTGLVANTTYSYTVSAYDNAGNVSAQSASASATTPSAGTPHSYKFDTLPTNTWVNISAANTPPDLSGWTSWVYDPGSGKGMVFGVNSDGYVPAYTNDVLIYDISTNAWTKVRKGDPQNCASTSIPGFGHGSNGISFDKVTRKFIITTLESQCNWDSRTIAYDIVTNQFSLLNSGSAVGPAGEQAMVYDEQNGVHVLFGGMLTGNLQNSTWVFDTMNNTWTQKNPNDWNSTAVDKTLPYARSNHNLAYDSLRKKVVLYGGNAFIWPSTDKLVNDLWVYDTAANTWTKVNATNAPPPRAYASFSYDSRNDVFLLVGGNTVYDGTAATDVYDTWAFDFKTNAWMKRSPVGTPQGRIVTTMNSLIYDPIRNVHLYWTGGTTKAVWAFRYGNGGVPVAGAGVR